VTGDAAAMELWRRRAEDSVGRWMVVTAGGGSGMVAVKQSVLYCVELWWTSSEKHAVEKPGA